MIKITNLQKYYRTEEVETVALNNLNIHVKEGEFVADLRRAVVESDFGGA